VAVDLARVRAVIDRIAADVDELARARRAQDLSTAAVLPDRRGSGHADHPPACPRSGNWTPPSVIPPSEAVPGARAAMGEPPL